LHQNLILFIFMHASLLLTCYYTANKVVFNIVSHKQIGKHYWICSS